MNKLNLKDLLPAAADRLAQLTSELNDANSKQEYNRAEQLEEELCRLVRHGQKRK